jgi:hypothetical protein
MAGYQQSRQEARKGPALVLREDKVLTFILDL